MPGDGLTDYEDRHEAGDQREDEKTDRERVGRLAGRLVLRRGIEDSERSVRSHATDRGVERGGRSPGRAADEKNAPGVRSSAAVGAIERGRREDRRAVRPDHVTRASGDADHLEAQVRPERPVVERVGVAPDDPQPLRGSQRPDAQHVTDVDLGLIHRGFVDNDLVGAVKIRKATAQDPIARDLMTGRRVLGRHQGKLPICAGLGRDVLRDDTLGPDLGQMLDPLDSRGVVPSAPWIRIRSRRVDHDAVVVGQR